MGYDITFHPFSRKEFSYYIEDVIQAPSEYVSRLAKVHSDREEQAVLSANVYSRIGDFIEEVKMGDSAYEQTVGLAITAILGYLHPYWYARGGMLSALKTYPEFKSIFKEISSIAREETRFLFDQAHNQIIGNYSSGTYVPYENIGALKMLLEDEKNHSIVEETIGDYNKESLLNCLEYCLINRLDLLEAADIFIPATGEVSTYYPNARAPHLNNIMNFENNSKKSSDLTTILEEECPRCLGKGHVDWDDIKRLKQELRWRPGRCAYCNGTGKVEATQIEKVAVDNTYLTTTRSEKERNLLLNNDTDTLEKGALLEQKTETFIEEVKYLHFIGQLSPSQIIDFYAIQFKDNKVGVAWKSDMLQYIEKIITKE
ncbi:hypothetical protein [Algivirga pacifica]|uniref:Uncharacterized protein n=1 Tax=Algivirga pacifica TaxID=1162670 RepID=A0ABP9CZ10_9BACT